MVGRRRKSRRSTRRLGTQYRTSLEGSNLSLAPAVSAVQLSKLSAVVLLVLLAWGIYSIFNLDAFFVYADSTEVRGNVVVSPEEVYSVSEVEGTSIFWVKPALVADRVVTGLPNVKAARVAVRLPARVIINVEERAPSLVWQTGEERWWIDAEGAVVPLKAELSDVLTVVDLDGQPAASGDRLDMAVLAAIRALHYLKPDLSVMYYSKQTGISFQSPEGWPVYLGDDEAMQEKLEAFDSLRQTLLAQGKTPAYVDIRFPESPFYR